MWARIENGRVCELTDIDPAGRFHPDMHWRSCPDEVQVGWSLSETGEFAGEPIIPRSEAESQAWIAIKQERDRRTQQGGFRVGEYWFHSDVFSRSQQLGLVMLGDTLPEVQWKTMSGEFVSMTPALAQAIFTAGVASDMAVFAAAEAHRTATLASTDPLAYDFTEGWPPVYVPVEG